MPLPKYVTLGGFAPKLIQVHRIDAVDFDIFGNQLCGVHFAEGQRFTFPIERKTSRFQTGLSVLPQSLRI